MECKYIHVFTGSAYKPVVYTLDSCLYDANSFWFSGQTPLGRKRLFKGLRRESPKEQMPSAPPLHPPLSTWLCTQTLNEWINKAHVQIHREAALLISQIRSQSWAETCWMKSFRLCLYGYQWERSIVTGAFAQQSYQVFTFCGIKNILLRWKQNTTELSSDYVRHDDTMIGKYVFHMEVFQSA